VVSVTTVRDSLWRSEAVKLHDNGRVCSSLCFGFISSIWFCFRVVR